jgi:hypothetical protein
MTAHMPARSTEALAPDHCYAKNDTMVIDGTSSGRVTVTRSEMSQNDSGNFLFLPMKIFEILKLFCRILKELENSTIFLNLHLQFLCQPTTIQDFLLL